MRWFIEAANRLKAQGVREISVVSETLTTHEYESKTLAKAFEEITGIKVKHDLLQEGDVVEKLQTSMQSGKSIYDGWISDSDLIGTHFRYGQILPLSDYLAGAGKPFTHPDSTWRISSARSSRPPPDGKLYQLPDQQFANLYWFRADWFARADLKERFRKKYGYELRRAAQLERVRGHRQFLLGRRETARWAPRLRPHGLRQERPLARLAIHRRMAVDGRRRGQRHPERHAGR